MEVSGKAVLVTGGAGFIGSHLADRLVDLASEVIVFDNLSAGRLSNLGGCLKRRNFRFVKGDLLDPKAISKAVERCDLIFHLAANPEVRIGAEDARIDFKQNLVATRNLLEAARKAKVEGVAFTSTSTVYGEASRMPTPEDYGPLKPISLYGASKLGCEALLSAYSHLFGFASVIYRFANVVGSRSRHGVIYDFIRKLMKDREALEILGDGTQTKSYIYVSDCVDAILFGLRHSREDVEVFNIGSEDQISVTAIAKIVIEEMGLKNVKLRFTGGVGGRGWPGDVKLMLLSVQKLKKLGWRPKYSSAEAVRRASRELMKELKAF
ncbi:TPA: NAD-dependent epimerase/dehydratase family protein [Candidatus Bathyarchaeota archaeon]|nr:NAD-dependent epimerase/dehydratase family protein [Candidatus Bathyarchaeota archaeon]